MEWHTTAIWWKINIWVRTKSLCDYGNRLIIGDGECFVIPPTNEVTAADQMDEYRQCFSSELKDIGSCKITTMNIELTTDKSVSIHPYSVPFAKPHSMNKMVDELLDNGIVVKSNSPYASPPVLVKRANGDDRMCIMVKQPFPTSYLRSSQVIFTYLHLI